MCSVTQSCPPSCDPIFHSLLGSSVLGILHARILELPFPTPGDLPDPGIEPLLLCLLHWQVDVPPGKPQDIYCSWSVTSSFPTLCSPPGSSVHGISQARILKWIAIPFSRRSSWPRDQTHVSCVSCIAGSLFITEPLGKPHDIYK